MTLTREQIEKVQQLLREGWTTQWIQPFEAEALCEMALSSIRPEALEKRRSDFIEAILNLALKRQMGYAERRHGDVLNKECMDEVVQLCKGMAKAAIETTLSPLARSQEKT